MPISSTTLCLMYAFKSHALLLDLYTLLQSNESPWQNVTYLLDLCQWLYHEQLPDSDAINQLESVVETLIDFQERETNSMDESKPAEIEVSQSSKLPCFPNSATKVTERTHLMPSVRQLETLMRVHVMLALLYGRGTTEHREMSLVAVGFCFKLWKVRRSTPLLFIVTSTNILLRYMHKTYIILIYL